MRQINYALGIIMVLFSVWGCKPPTDVTGSDLSWIESDSLEAIHGRMLKDFPVSYEVGAAEIINKYPNLTVDSILTYVNKHYIEAIDIDGEQRMFRAAIRNLGLLHPSLNGGWKHRGWDASPIRQSYADTIIQYTRGSMSKGGAHRVKIRFSVDVPYMDALKGDTLRVWMPYPIESQRQGDIKLISTSEREFTISDPNKSMHRTLYMQSPVTEGNTTHFDYVVEFTTAGQYFSPETIRKLIKPYDKKTADYQKYTAFDGPHYVCLDSLAHEIVGDEDDPYAQSEMVYDYIINHYPWASAREYSTITCIPEYVISEGHGDCGQVALLYISLMRSLGVPARWESGWMLHPGELNYHDWAEIYYNGVGWVPVDVSFGRYTSSSDPEIQKFYSTGIDSYRFAANTGIGGRFDPPKRYIRSETVDSQAGEVECNRGNLFYPLWTKNLEIISITSITK